MNVQEFEEELVALARKHDIEQLVVVFRNDGTLSTRAVATPNDVANQRGAKETAEICLQAILKNRDRILKVMGY